MWEKEFDFFDILKSMFPLKKSYCRLEPIVLFVETKRHVNDFEDRLEAIQMPDKRKESRKHLRLKVDDELHQDEGPIIHLHTGSPIHLKN
jgi:hypothetical protein